MSNDSLILALLIVGFLFLVFLFKSPKPKEEERLPRNPNEQDDEPIGHLKTIPELISEIPQKDKVELSWNFLYEVTDKILNTFSQEDKVILTETGKVLVKNGMAYVHVVDLAITKQHVQVYNQNPKKALQR
jgi:hypothetical protein